MLQSFHISSNVGVVVLGEWFLVPQRLQGCFRKGKEKGKCTARKLASYHIVSLDCQSKQPLIYSRWPLPILSDWKNANP